MAIPNNALIAIHTASAAAVGVSASPIPFSDSALLIPIQTTMIMSIYKSYNQEISEGFLQGALKATAVSALGKGVAGNLLKLVPGVGTVAGAFINAGVAVAFTEAMGFGVANALENSTNDNSVDILKVLSDIALNFKRKN